MYITYWHQFLKKASTVKSLPVNTGGSGLTGLPEPSYILLVLVVLMFSTFHPFIQKGNRILPPPKHTGSPAMLGDAPLPPQFLPSPQHLAV